MGDARFWNHQTHVTEATAYKRGFRLAILIPSFFIELTVQLIVSCPSDVT